MSRLFLGLSFSFSVSRAVAPEEEGERGAAGGCDPGLRKDSHGEEQPPEGSRQDGQRRYFSSLHCACVSLQSLYARAMWPIN